MYFVFWLQDIEINVELKDIKLFTRWQCFALGQQIWLSLLYRCNDDVVGVELIKLNAFSAEVWGGHFRFYAAAKTQISPKNILIVEIDAGNERIEVLGKRLPCCSVVVLWVECYSWPITFSALKRSVTFKPQKRIKSEYVNFICSISAKRTLFPLTSIRWRKQKTKQQ